MRVDWVFWAFCLVQAVLIGILIGTSTIWELDISIAPYGGVEFFIHRYQTMIAAAVTLGGAAIGARAIFSQIKHSDQLATDARERRMAGARAMMPLALSQIVSYADASGRTLDGLYNQCVMELMPTPAPIAPRQPEFPDEAIRQLRDAIENGSNELSLDVSLLLARIQVQRSRISEVISQALGTGRTGLLVLSTNLETYIVDSAEIYARAAALFDYARRRSEHTTKIETPSVIQALKLMGFDDFTHPRVFERADLRTDWDKVPA